MVAAFVLPMLVIGSGAGTTFAQTTAPPATAPQDETLALRQRAAEYWSARTKRDYRTQWELTEPRFKARVPPEQYGAGKGAIQYLGYEVGDARIDGYFGVVDVKVIARIAVPSRSKQPMVRTGTVPDAWVKIDGTWYRRADQPDASPQDMGRP
jgi:hypothetical protein